MGNEVFSTRIKELREKAGLTMEQLATKLNITKSRVSMWENNGTIPRMDTLISLAKFFNVTTDFLLGNDDEKNISTYNAKLGYLQRNLGKLNESDLEKAEGMLKAVFMDIFTMRETMMTYDKNAYKSVNYKKIYSIANEFLVSSSYINDFPFKVRPFIEEQSDIYLCSYKKAIQSKQVDIRLFGSESAVIMDYRGAYIIYYNQDEPDYRVRFSIMHEFGHYILHHKTKLRENDQLYHTQELEANCFAAQILMPEQLLRECANRHKELSIEFIKNSFGVSDEAAEKRRKTLANTTYEWRSREESDLDEAILYKYSQKLNTIAPKPSEFDYYSYEEEYDRQRERDSWLDQRSRYR